MSNNELATYKPFFIDEAGQKTCHLIAIDFHTNMPKDLAIFTSDLNGTRLNWKKETKSLRLIDKSKLDLVTFSLDTGQKQGNIISAVSFAKFFEKKENRETLRKLSENIKDEKEFLTSAMMTLMRNLTPHYPDAAINPDSDFITVENTTSIPVKVVNQGSNGNGKRNNTPSGAKSSASIRKMHIWI